MYFMYNPAPLWETIYYYPKQTNILFKMFVFFFVCTKLCTVGAGLYIKYISI